MICGVRFCGGCNPRYDRGKALEKIKEQNKDVDFRIAEEGETYDHLLVIGGCTNCCASHCQFSTRKGLTKMWDEKHINEVLKKIDEIKSKEKAKRMYVISVK